MILQLGLRIAEDCKGCDEATRQIGTGCREVPTGAGVSLGLMLRIRVWYFFPSIGSITSKAMREQPGFALRAESDAIRSTSHKRSCTASRDGIVSITAIKSSVTATE